MTAYLVLIINTEPEGSVFLVPRIEGVGIFSEATPTFGTKLHTVVLADMPGETYEVAKTKLLTYIDGSLRWVKRLPGGGFDR